MGSGYLARQLYKKKCKNLEECVKQLSELNNEFKLYNSLRKSDTNEFAINNNYLGYAGATKPLYNNISMENVVNPYRNDQEEAMDISKINIYGPREKEFEKEMGKTHGDGTYEKSGIHSENLEKILARDNMIKRLENNPSSAEPKNILEVTNNLEKLNLSLENIGKTITDERWSQLAECIDSIRKTVDGKLLKKDHMLNKLEVNNEGKNRSRVRYENYRKPENKNNYNYRPQEPTYKGNNMYEINRKQKSRPDVVCYNCGRPNHVAKECRLPIKNTRPGVICYNCGRPNHVATECREPSRRKNGCFRCGKANHFAKDCYLNYNSLYTKKRM